MDVARYSTMEESLQTKIANRDRKIGHLEDKISDLYESRARRVDAVSVCVCVCVCVRVCECEGGSYVSACNIHLPFCLYQRDKQASYPTSPSFPHRYQRTLRAFVRWS